jgi:hypothetical protein
MLGTPYVFVPISEHRCHQQYRNLCSYQFPSTDVTSSIAFTISIFVSSPHCQQYESVDTLTPKTQLCTIQAIIVPLLGKSNEDAITSYYEYKSPDVRVPGSIPIPTNIVVIKIDITCHYMTITPINNKQWIVEDITITTQLIQWQFMHNLMHSPWVQVSAAMLMRSSLFWDITQRRVVILYRRFGKTYRSHLQGSISVRSLLEP